MVKFRISLKLHNFKGISNKKYSKEKTTKITKFYKIIAHIIKSIHNNEVKRTQQQFKDYYEPLIKIKKNIFTTIEPPKDFPLIAFIDTMCPPTIDIDIEFKMSSREEDSALRQFYKDYKGSVNRKSYTELKALYYSTKIINFVNRLRCLINENVLWTRYRNIAELKTKYTPIITVSDTAVLSLN